MYSVEQMRLLLQKLNKKLELIVTKELDKSGLTTSQIIVLGLIADSPKTIGQISKAMRLSNGTVSGIIDRLEKENYVERVRDCEDRRVVWIHKTEKYENPIKEPAILRDLSCCNLFSGLTEAEVEQFVTILEKMDESMTVKIKGELGT